MGNKRKGKNFFARTFDKFFGFESGIDIANEVELLSRRNFVMRNIITVSNFFYTILFLVVSLIDPTQTSSWIFLVISFLMTIAVSYVLKKLGTEKNDITKQKVAMYVSALFAFISAVLVYVKVNTAPLEFETAGYVIIFYSLVVISLYQDKKLLTNSFLLLLIGVTTVHVVVTYDLTNEPITNFLTSRTFLDIIIRTIIFVVFFFVVYIIVSIGQYMQEERKKELVKRRNIQDDFANIVSDLFTVVFSASENLMTEKHARQVYQMAEYLGKDYGLKNDELIELRDYCLVHLEFNKIKSLIGHSIEEDLEDDGNFERLKEKTELGSLIAKRLQLAQKCENIARAQLEGTNSKDFIEEMNQIQSSIISQVILLSDLYITMRDVTPYKRPIAHKQVIQLFQNDLGYYFDYSLKERFLRFNADFEKMYNSF